MLAVKLIGQHGGKGTGSGRHGSGHTVPSPSGRHLVREGVSGRFVGRSSQWQLFLGGRGRGQMSTIRPRSNPSHLESAFNHLWQDTSHHSQHTQMGRLKMRDMKIRDGQKCRGGKCET